MYILISSFSSMAARVKSCDITLCATWEFTGEPTKTMRFRSSNVCKSAGPEGVNTAGVIVGEPFFADVILSLHNPQAHR
jgi:hypothetical protein